MMEVTQGRGLFILHEYYITRMQSHEAILLMTVFGVEFESFQSMPPDKFGLWGCLDNWQQSLS